MRPARENSGGVHREYDVVGKPLLCGAGDGCWRKFVEGNGFGYVWTVAVVDESSSSGGASGDDLKKLGVLLRMVLVSWQVQISTSLLEPLRAYFFALRSPRYALVSSSRRSASHAASPSDAIFLRRNVADTALRSKSLAYYSSRYRPLPHLSPPCDHRGYSRTIHIAASQFGSLAGRE